MMALFTYGHLSKVKNRFVFQNSENIYFLKTYSCAHVFTIKKMDLKMRFRLNGNKCPRAMEKLCNSL
jgi:hypothetical protein